MGGGNDDHIPAAWILGEHVVEFTITELLADHLGKVTAQFMGQGAAQGLGAAVGDDK